MQDIKKTIVAENEIEVYNDQFIACLDEFCQTFGIENMTDEPQNRWSAFLQFTHNKIFGFGHKIKTADEINYDILNELSEIYMYYCQLYDKEITILGLADLTGISVEVFTTAKNNPDTYYNGDKRLTDAPYRIYKKVNRKREESLSNKLQSGKNPVGIIAILNHAFKWSSEQVRDEEIARQSVNALTAAEKYGLEIEDKKTENSTIMIDGIDS